MVLGFSFIVLYMNLFAFGYSILEYLEFVITRIECLIFFIGLLIFILLLWKK